MFLRVVLAGALLAFSAFPAFAWFPQGHSIIARSAAKIVPTDMPAWFRKGADQIAHDAQDPDIQKNKALPLMTEIEYPRHYIDFELLQNNPLPVKRADYYALCKSLNQDPGDVGELPYSLREYSERLAMDFAEARKYPNNRYIRTKTLVTAGILSHYSGDCVMPLHVTNDHDGRHLPDGKSPKTGIHAKVDSLVERINPSKKELEANQPLAPITDIWSAINAEILDSRTHIDETYALEPQLPPSQGAWTPSPQVRAFTIERARAGVNWTARLYAWAWAKSAQVELPTWLRREGDAH
ncbi:hypothetical protein IAD21_03030 [Abditibacteriota bacterium]|nr:hypothetical protein IAD21_03030 [Abditibacteriota bacterium]